MLRSQHGPAIQPAADEIVEAVQLKLSELAPEGESFTTPDVGETDWAIAFAGRAKNWSEHKVHMLKGGVWQACHDSSSQMALLKPDRFKHVFGYALDTDKHWRTHSWVHDLKTNEIIETTPSKRRIYIGVELDAS